MVWLAVGAGGAIGAMLRYGVNAAVQGRLGGAFPAGIFLINVSGCLAIGLLAGALAGGRLQMGELARQFVAAGILGGFTTFSTYGLDTFTLVRGGQTAAAVLNAGGQVLLGVAAVAVGYVVASRI